MSGTDDAIGRIAAREAGPVLDAAVAKARQRAEERLADALTDALVRSALAAYRPQPAAQEQEDQQEQEDAGAGLGRYAYAITGSAPLDLGGLPGLRDHPVDTVEQGELRLVISEIPLAAFERLSEDDLTEGSELAELARRHDEVVRAVGEQAAVLPLRFGTVVADAAAGRRLLAERAGRAHALLDHVRAHREWGVRVTEDEPAAERPAPEDGPRPTGTEYLARRRSAREAEQRRREHTTALLSEAFDALGRHAGDSVRRHGRQGALLDGAFLVERAREELFFAEVRRLAGELAEQGLRLDTTGPWPPYSFARLEEESGDG